MIWSSYNEEHINLNLMTKKERHDRIAGLDIEPLLVSRLCHLYPFHVRRLEYSNIKDWGEKNLFGDFTIYSRNGESYIFFKEHNDLACYLLKWGGL